MIKALWHDNPTASSLKEVVLENGASGMIHIQSLYSFISLGTERTIAKGGIPSGLDHEMDVPYMEGTLQLPVKYGYSLVGKVIDHGHELEEKSVHLLHPHQSVCQVYLQDCFVIPDGIPPLRATLASNMETAVNAIWDAQISIGDRVLIVGFGIIGALIASVADQLPGVVVHIVEQNSARKEQAKALGFTTVDTPVILDYDLAFNTSGHESGLQLAIDAVGLEGRIMEMSWYGGKSVSLNLGGDFHWKRKKIISSQVGLIPNSKQHRWNYFRRKELVFELLKNPIYDRFITNILDFEDSPAFFNRLRTEQVNDLGGCIKYP